MANQKEIWCFRILMGSVGFFLVLSFLGFYFGDAHKLTRGYDASALACGEDIGLAEYPYAYIVNPDPEYIHRVVCVKQCPASDENGQIKSLDCITNSEIKSCKQSISIFDQSATVMYYDSFAYKENVCVPSTLDYFNTIKNSMVPSSINQTIHDVSITRYLILFMALPAVGLCALMMYLLKVQTKLTVWGFAIILFILMASFGVYCSSQFVTAMAYSTPVSSIGTFKVSAQYIHQMTNIPSTTGNFILGFILVMTTLYAGYWLYHNSKRIDGLCDLFEIVEIFLEQNEAIENMTSYTFQYALVSILAIIFFTILHLASCFQVVDNESKGPFEQVQPNILTLLNIPIVFISFWILQCLQGIIEYTTNRVLVIWFNGFINYESHEHQQIQRQQAEHNQVRMALQEARQQLQPITYSALLLIQSPLQFIADWGRDNVENHKNSSLYKYFKGCCCLCYKYYEKTCTIEPIIYIELASGLAKAPNVSVARDNISKVLQAEIIRNRTTINCQETYEQIRNIGQFFIVVTKFFVAIIIAGFMSVILSSVPYFSTRLYSPYSSMGISALIGYYVATVYFIPYSASVQGLGYLHLRKLINESEDSQNKLEENYVKQFKNLIKIITELSQEQQVQGQ